VYYDLLKRRKETGRDDVAVIRVEQLFPLPEALLAEALAPYAAGLPACWVQEESANMGAWPHLRLRFGAELCGRPFRVFSRPASASPATGSAASHKLEQARLLDAAFGTD